LTTSSSRAVSAPLATIFPWFAPPSFFFNTYTSFTGGRGPARAGVPAYFGRCRPEPVANKKILKIWRKKYSLNFSSDGYVTLQEFMALMINKETENVRTSEDIEMAFRALSKELRP
jgi:hypothetical protein